MGELLNLLDGFRSPLFEGGSEDLSDIKLSALSPFPNLFFPRYQQPPLPPSRLLQLPPILPVKTDSGIERRTLLCKWMVYSRATTSASAERPPLVLGLGAGGAISFYLVEVIVSSTINLGCGAAGTVPRGC